VRVIVILVFPASVANGLQLSEARQVAATKYSEETEGQGRQFSA